MADRKHRYSTVSRRIWGDAKVKRLSPPAPCGRFLWVWLLTCEEQSSVPGLIRLGEAGMAEAIGWPVRGLRKAMSELLTEKMIEVDWSARLVWIPNRVVHSPPANPNVVTSWSHDWDELPDCDMKWRAHAALYAWCRLQGQAWASAFSASCPNPHVPTEANPSANPSGNHAGNPSGKGTPIQEQEQDQEQDQEQKQEGNPSTAPLDTDPGVLAIAAELARHDVIVRIVPSFIKAAEKLFAFWPPFKPVEPALEAIREAAHDTPDGEAPDKTKRRIRTYVEQAAKGERRGHALAAIEHPPHFKPDTTPAPAASVAAGGAAAVAKAIGGRP